VIRFVTFDFWQTLVVDTPENLDKGKAMRLAGTARVLEQAGRPAPPAALEAAYEASGRALVERFWAGHRDLPHREQVRVFLELAAPGVTAGLPALLFEEAVEAYITPVLRLLPHPVPGAFEAVQALRKRDVALGIVSNTGRTPGLVLRRVLDHYGLLGAFTAMAFSDEVGFRKPHPAIFADALRRAGAEPAAALHVGDDAATDVAGARRAGMRAAHLSPAAGAPEADIVLGHLADLPGRLAALGF
jgi:putative hydrolase of the HAD superfamily